jgi:hypothetical protein
MDRYTEAARTYMKLGHGQGLVVLQRKENKTKAAKPPSCWYIASTTGT